MREVEKLCDRIAVIHKGRILAQGTLAELAAQYDQPDVEELFFELIQQHDQSLRRLGGGRRSDVLIPRILTFMNWRNVKLIFWREVSDQLRDRRTLFMVVLLPLLLYPSSGVGMMEMTVTFTEQPRTVVVLNADDLPDPQLIKDGRFLAKFFKSPDDLDKIKVLTDDSRTDVTTLSAARAGVSQGREGAAAEDRGAGPADRLRVASVSREGRAGTLRASSPARTDELRPEISNWFEKSPVQVLVVVPPRA